MDDPQAPPVSPEPLPTDAPPPVPATGPMGPVGESERIVTIDVLRGFALLGIFFVNVQFFGLPMMHAVGMGAPDLVDGTLAELLGPSALDGGSTDNCEIQDTLASPSSFDCDDLGACLDQGLTVPVAELFFHRQARTGQE